MAEIRGIKTSEFYISVVAMVFAALLASGVFAPDSPWAQIVGATLSVLAAAGYTAARTSLKKAEGAASGNTRPPLPLPPPHD